MDLLKLSFVLMSSVAGGAVGCVAGWLVWRFGSPKVKDVFAVACAACMAFTVLWRGPDAVTLVANVAQASQSIASR